MLGSRFCLVAVLMALSLYAGAVRAADVSGSRDCPLVQRYEGSEIIGYDYRQFDQMDLITGPLKSYDKPPVPSEKITGRHTRLLYVCPPDRSPLEVFSNYLRDLEADGYRILFSCTEAECGKKNALARVLYGDRKLKNRGQMSEMAFSFPAEPLYLAARLTRPEGEVSVSLYVAREEFDHFKETADRTLVLLDVVEAAPMERKMVTVDAGEMARSIASQGAVALYGIYFDTDKTDVKPESAPTLEEISRLLASDPGLKLYVVGHTDGVGGFNYNMDLSRRRAQSVVRALVSEYGADARRLTPAGVGFLAPIGANDAEDGRARNRRVELVRDMEK